MADRQRAFVNMKVMQLAFGLGVALSSVFASAGVNGSPLPEDPDLVCPEADASTGPTAQGKQVLLDLLKEAEREFEAGRFGASLAMTCEVYRSTGKAPLLYNIAQAQRSIAQAENSLDHCVFARTAYKAYVVHGEKKHLRGYASDYLSELGHCEPEPPDDDPSTQPGDDPLRPEGISESGASPQAREKDAVSSVPATVWALTSTAVATATAGAVLYALARDHRVEAESGTFDPELRQQAEFEQDLSWLLFGASAAFAVSGAVDLWLWLDDDEAASLTATLVPTPRGARARVKLTF